MDSTAELALVLKAKNLASREVDQLSGSLAKVDTQAKRSGSGLAGFAKVAAIGVVGAVAGVVAVIGKATAAAAEEQKGIAQLNAALKANVKGFDGNTDAIEAAIASRERLAFSDDDLRDSLTFLVTKTKDATEALALQETAMDLARLKGIGLTEASQMLTKGLDGNAKILAQLGIDLPKTASEQERLTAIQAAAAGQAKAYGETAAGAQEAFQIALDDLMEDLGELFLPLLKDVMTFLRDTVLPAIRNVIGAVKDWVTENKPLVDAIGAFVGGVLKTFVSLLGSVFDWLGKIIGWITSNKTIMKGLATMFQNIADQVDRFVAGLKWIVNNIGKILSAINRVNENPNSPAYHYLHGTNVPGSAAGGWVGLNGPELRMVGERGPEYVIPNHQLGMGGSPAVVVLQLDGREVARVVDERLFYRYAAAAAGTRS